MYLWGTVAGGQCDQIGLFIALWTTFQSQWQELFACKIVVENNENKQKEAGVGPIFKNYLPRSSTFFAIFVKVSKSIIILVQSILGNFYEH